MPSEPSGPFYVSVETYLQQGDIFQAPIITPFADLVPRLFRTTDGRHGSVVFSEQASGKVFTPDELDVTLQDLPRRTPLHTRAFESTPDGHPELVVASAQLAEFFIVASQTCDVCGVDKAAKPLAVVLRASPLRSLCISERLPFDGLDRPALSIHDYLVRETRSAELQSADHDSYGTVLREVLAAWNVRRETKGKLANTIRGLLRGNENLFYLKPDTTFGMTEMSVDLTTIYTVPTQFLAERIDRRKACLEVSYRNQFAQNLGLRFSRIAVPAPVEPEKLV